MEKRNQIELVRPIMKATVMMSLMRQGVGNTTSAAKDDAC